MNETKWTLYTENQETWSAMLSACESAKKSIDLENFIFTSDEIGRKFIDLCARKAAEGVKVRFIWDAAGSFRFFGSSIVEELRSKNIELRFFKTLFPGIFNFHRYRSWYFRNHRRTLVVDGSIGFTGSVCISKRMDGWRDTSVRIEGLVVKDMQLSFEKMWDRALGIRVNKRRKTNANDHEFEYVTNNPFPSQRFLYRRTIEAIRSAENSISITVPYFVPTRRLSRVIRLAAHRGVDVKIILPENSDFPTLDLAARTFFHGMMKIGVRIYLYKGRMIHSKTIVIDDNWASVGTLNLDNISLRYNFEANIVTHNGQFIDELKKHFANDLRHCEEVIFEEWDRRFFVEKIATFFVKLIRRFL